MRKVEEAISIAILTPDENFGRLLLEKIKKYFPRMPFDIGLFSEAQPAFLYIERNIPSIVFLANQVPGAKQPEILKNLETFCPHAFIIKLNPEMEGIEQLDNGMINLGVPVLDWDKVILLLENEIPTELKFRFGIARRESFLLQKLKTHAQDFSKQTENSNPSQAFMPISFESTEQTQSDSRESLAVTQEKESTAEQSATMKRFPTKKEEWIILASTGALAIIFHLPWSDKGNWELVRGLCNFLLGVSIIGFMLKPFSDPKLK